MFDFYWWLSHVCSMFQIILSQSCFNFTGTRALLLRNHVFLATKKSLSISEMVPKILYLLFSFHFPIFTIVEDSNILLARKSAFYKLRPSTKGLWSIKWWFWHDHDRIVSIKVALTATHSNPFSLQNFCSKTVIWNENFGVSLSTSGCGKHCTIPWAKYPFVNESLLKQQQLGVANPRLAWTQAEALQLIPSELKSDCTLLFSVAIVL